MSNCCKPEPPSCCCGAQVLIFACSGASNVGQLTDLAARKITQEGWARMGCLAAVAAHVPSTEEAARAAETLLVLDGCPFSCAKKTVEQAGVEHIHHLLLSNLGLLRGKADVSTENIDRVVHAAKDMLAAHSGKATNEL